MTPQRRHNINALADLVRSSCKLSIPIEKDDLRDAIENLGGELVEKLVGVPADFDARITKQGSGFKIEIADKPNVREKFSIAHELGHLFLHMDFANKASWDSKTDYEYVDSTFQRMGRTEEEFEAHEFAAALLMPADDFKNFAEERRTEKGYPIKPIAVHFGVSQEAATTRGRWLQLFSWD
jgi:Zn-dependent peptidase ImmA (M78 family)